MNLSRIALELAEARVRSIPPADPDEVDGPCLCDVCQAEVNPVILANVQRWNTRWTRHYRRDPARPVVCSACRVKGWRGRWCECGAVMHKRDYQGGACRKCRAERREDSPVRNQWSGVRSPFSPRTGGVDAA